MSSIVALGIVMFNFTCPEPTIINNYSKETSYVDNLMVIQAKNTCRVQYNKCLKTFIIKGFQDYQVICGGG